MIMIIFGPAGINVWVQMFHPNPWTVVPINRTIKVCIYKSYLRIGLWYISFGLTPVVLKSGEDSESPKVKKIKPMVINKTAIKSNLL